MTSFDVVVSCAPESMSTGAPVLTVDTVLGLKTCIKSRWKTMQPIWVCAKFVLKRKTAQNVFFRTSHCNSRGLMLLLGAFTGSYRYTKIDAQRKRLLAQRNPISQINSNNVKVVTSHVLDLLGVRRRRLCGFLPRFLDDEQYGDGGNSQQTNHQQRNCML